MESLIGSASGIAIGAYLCAVVWNGNVTELGALLKNEEGYIEFIVALLVLGMIQKYGPGGQVSAALTAGAIITMLIRFGKNSNINQSLALFASGQKSALDTIKAILEGK